jgi:redox-sensitive bicupin YhaK (pirin superfamily)
MSETASNPVVVQGHSVVDGAGVRLRRVFGFDDTELTDPFLLLDAFNSDDPDEYIDGFPWHPHRGIETVTYMIHGSFEHADNLGNRGTISDGDVQWMTAGSGIIHQEMPQIYEGTLCGFQLWVNLPAEHKMTDPRYRSIDAGKIPCVKKDGASVRVICGSFEGTEGAAEEIIASPVYLDVELEAGGKLELSAAKEKRSIIYVFEGSILLGGERYYSGDCIIFRDSEFFAAESFGGPARFLFLSGSPLKEPVAWRGPIVMNTDEELDTAFQELKESRFVKVK